MDQPTTRTPATDDPIAVFAAWMAEATKSEPNDPNAVCLPPARRKAGLPPAWCC
jgi:pyridoxamine 5'-phosphate oxidase